jgi:predicted metalloprotease
VRWQSGRRSDNVEDRRGARRGKRALLGGGIGLAAIVAIAAYFGFDVRPLMQLIGNLGGQAGAPAVDGDGGGGAAGGSGTKDELSEFVRVVLGDTEDVWTDLFAKLGKRYDVPKLVLFSSSIDSQCGFAESTIGPFYCPADRKVYIDLSFYEDLRQKLGAPGDFAQAYVIAHEIGHHVQNLLGTSDMVHAKRGVLSEVENNRLSVRLELQADFFAGVWAHHAQKARDLLEHGDVDEALGAANAIGDDRLQRQSRGQVVPDSFTHGTSAQRMKWFRAGLETGDVSRGDTFRLRDDEL